ncbi:MAG: outer membrane protein assembly factor BamD [candidate division WOR-3 bacterium]
MKGKILFFSLFFIFLLCAKKELFKGNGNIEEIFKKSIEFYNKRKYKQAIEGFKKVIYAKEISENTDDAQFYLAMCYYKIKDYEQSFMEFKFLKDHFPQSEYREESEFMMIKIEFSQLPNEELDQEKTYEIIRNANNFIKNYPESKFKKETEDIIKKCREKIAKKLFNTMNLYLKMGKKESAKIYFQILKEEYSDLEIYKKASKIFEDRK